MAVSFLFIVDLEIAQGGDNGMSLSTNKKGPTFIATFTGCG